MDYINEMQEPGQPSLAMDVFKQAINPLNYYIYNPGAFNSKLGIKVPFDITKFKNLNKGANELKGISKISKYLSSGVKSFSPFSGEFLDPGGVLRKSEIHQGRINKLNSQIKKIDYRINKYKKLDRRKELKLTPKTFEEFSKGDFQNIIDKTVIRDGKAFYQKRKLNTDNINKLSATKNKLTQQKNNIRKKISGAKWAKRGLQAAKGFAIFNIMSLAADIGGMVGRPIGDGIVEIGDKFLGQLHDRYLPEMGKLSPGFLSSGSATERQRAIQAISKSQINGRYALGNEASLYHS